MSRHNPKSGFTLLEILVYIAVLGIVAVIVVSFVIWLSHSNAKNKAMREALDNSRRAMEIMAYEIKEAKAVYTPTTDAGQLSLETTKYLPPGEEDSYIDFYLCGSSLCLKKESQEPAALTSDSVEVNNLVFERVVSGEASSLRISIGVNYKNPANRPEYQASVNLTSSVSLRPN